METSNPTIDPTWEDPPLESLGCVADFLDPVETLILAGIPAAVVRRSRRSTG